MKMMNFLIAAAGVVIAGPEFHVSDAVKGFHAEHGRRHHRSGLSALEQADLDTAAPAKAATGTLSYLAIGDSSGKDSREVPVLESHLRKSGFEVSRTGFHIRATAKGAVSRRGHGRKLDTAEAANYARAVIRSSLPREVWRNLDLLSVGVEHKQASGSDVQVSGYDFRYYRVQNGRVVRDASNYVSLSVSPEGDVSSVEASWPALTATATKVDVSNGDSVASKQLRKILESNYVSATRANGEKFETASFEVSGIADAWCPETVGGKDLLVPCESFSVQLTSTDAKKLGVLVDAPVVEEN